MLNLRMLIELIITIFIFLICIAIMSIGVIISNKTLKGSCGGSNENPRNCTLVEKMKCTKQKLIS